jgi:hypothetical protein
MNEKHHKILLKINSTVCFKCQTGFDIGQEVVILKNSSKLHKPCYDELKEMVGEESDNV